MERIATVCAQNMQGACNGRASYSSMALLSLQATSRKKVYCVLAYPNLHPQGGHLEESSEDIGFSEKWNQNLQNHFTQGFNGCETSEMRASAYRK